jgi:hypothetical protein
VFISITIATESEQVAFADSTRRWTKTLSDGTIMYQHPVNRCWWTARETYEMETFGRVLAINERRESKMWVPNAAAVSDAA